MRTCRRCCGGKFFGDYSVSATHSGESCRLRKTTELNGALLGSLDFINRVGDIRILNICLISSLSSWRFFEQMLYEANVVGTPGVGFGPSGEGYIRLTAFGERNDCIEAMRRIKNWL